MKAFILALGLSLTSGPILHGHDTWFQLNTPQTSPGHPVYLDLMLGNHGNNHRDFKPASKARLEGSTLTLHGPEGSRRPLRFWDNGLTEKDGMWSTRLTLAKPGLYTAAQKADGIAFYAPKRQLRSAKAFLKVGDTPVKPSDYARPLGHALEIIPLRDPSALKAGSRLPVAIYWKGQPLTGAVVSCLPQGTTLKKSFDPRYEARTNAKGQAALPLREANRYLLVVHHQAAEETGERYSLGTHYAATLWVQVGPDQ